MPVPQRESRVIVVTGASSGIGRETALRFARDHARIVLASRSEGPLREVARECRDAGATDVVFQSTDIAEADEVQRLFDMAVDRFGRVDVAVQSAANTAFGRFEDLPADVFETIIRTNLLGSANVARSALAEFRANRAGHLVLVGSLLGTVAVPNQSAYVASKFAINGLVRALRQENRDLPGLRVHGIYPGPVDTPVYGTAENYLTQTPVVPPSSVPAASIASAIYRATIRRHSSERQVGWFNRPAIAAYRYLPALFDALIEPFLKVTAYTSEAGDAEPEPSVAESR